METSGIHCIAELYDCPPNLLNDEAFIKQALRDAVERGAATLLHEVSHHFHPQGVTALGLIAESHVAIHTWPEYGYAAADVFTCGNRASAVKACEYLVDVLKAGRYSLKQLDRGMAINGPPAHGEAADVTSKKAQGASNRGASKPGATGGSSASVLSPASG